MAPAEVFQFQIICVSEGVCVPCVGAEGAVFTEIKRVREVPVPQALLGVTESTPEVAAGEKLARMELVAQPIVQVNPAPEYAQA